MLKKSLALSSLIIIAGCNTVPAGLENNFDQLKVKMQNGEIKKITDTGWYKSRSFVMKTGAYSWAMNATSGGGFYAITTPKYCQGIMGVMGLPLATEENKNIVNFRISGSLDAANKLTREWLLAYSPELKGACDAYKLFESEIKNSNGLYEHYLKSYDDEALTQDSFNIFVLMEQNKEKLLGVVNLSPNSLIAYTLKGEKMCETNKDQSDRYDTSVEGLLKIIQGPVHNKSIPGSCFGGKKVVFDLKGVELVGLMKQPKGNIAIRFEDGSVFNVSLVQFTDKPEVVKNAN
ncbi:MAG: hypothetical protein RL084_1860 [Pseudomonadota bacterium]|jgi:hypothetical protein